MTIDFGKEFRNRMICEAAVDPVIQRMAHHSLGALACSDPADDGVDVTQEFSLRSMNRLAYRHGLTDRAAADAVFVVIFGDMVMGPLMIK